MYKKWSEAIDLLNIKKHLLEERRMYLFFYKLQVDEEEIIIKSGLNYIVWLLLYHVIALGLHQLVTYTIYY